MEQIGPLILLALLIVASGFFSGSETALFSLSGPTIKSYKESKDPAKQKIASLVLKPRDLLVTIFMLNTLVNILIQNVISSAAGVNGSWLIKVGLPFALTLILGEIIPKNIGMDYNTSFAKIVIGPISFLHKYTSILRRWIIAVTYPISRVLFFFLKKEESISKEELQHVLTTSEEHGVLLPQEARLILGYLNLQSATVKEIMWPREDILFFDINEPLSKLVSLFVEKECSRIPVCDKDLDKTLGVISAKQYLLKKDKILSSDDLLKAIRKPFFIPESTPARLLLARLEEAHEELALVVDEYGMITGLITQEDLIEIVIGEIEDLRDQQKIFSQRNEESIISGKLELLEFNDLFQSNLESNKDMVTIGGWLTEQMGDIPKTGMTFETDRFFFQILQAEPTRIRKIFVRTKERGQIP